MTRRGFVAGSSAAVATAAGKTTFDVAVVGSGVFGAWIARTLYQRGQKVVLLDQYGPASNRASSGGETRIIRMGYGPKEIYTEWSWKAIRLYEEFYAKTDPTLFHKCGFLWMCREGDDYAKANLTAFQRLKIPHQRLDRAAMDKRFPQISFGECTWGIYEPEAGGLLARRGVQTVVRQSIKEGLTYQEAKLAVPTGGARSAELLTSQGEKISAGKIVYACGPWLPKLFPDLLGKKIRPTRQEVFYFGLSAGDRSYAPPAMPAWVDSGDTIYGLPDIETRGFKLAPDNHGVPVDPDVEKRLVPDASVDKVRAYVAKRFPGLAKAPLVMTEVCQYENTANGDYLIDRHPGYDNVWLVGGGSGHGYKHGPALGEYFADVFLAGKAQDPRFSLEAKPDITEGGRFSTIPPK
jgi:sarcosine oxidase